MPFDPNKFAEDILAGAKVDPATKQALLSAFNDPAVKAKLQDLNEGQMRQADYSRKQTEAQEALKKAQDWHNELTVWWETKKASPNQPEADTNGNVQDDLTMNQNKPTGITKQDVEQLLATREQDYLAVTTALQSIAFDHYKQFGEPLDTAAIIKKAQTDRTNIQIAYERSIQPKLAERAGKDLDERIKRERAEAAQEALANANIPSMGSLATLGGSITHPVDGLGKGTGSATPEFGWRKAAEAHTQAILSGKRITGDGGF